VHKRSLLAAAGHRTEEPVLVAGERAVWARPGSGAVPVEAAVTKLSLPAVKRALAWQERRLEFDAVPLAEVVGEFNRYNRTQLVIADAGLAAKRFSGAFRADGYESLVRLLEVDFGVRAARGTGEIVLWDRR
jgi:transmembrane sensor